MIALIAALFAGLITTLLVARPKAAYLCAGLAGGTVAFFVQHYVNLATDAGWSIRPLLYVGLAPVASALVVFLHRSGINEATNIPKG